jgi:hypothetical protein
MGKLLNFPKPQLPSLQNGTDHFPQMSVVKFKIMYRQDFLYCTCLANGNGYYF